jgi:hypothetical protein
MSAVCLPFDDSRPVSLDDEHMILGGWRIHEQGKKNINSIMKLTI